MQRHELVAFVVALFAHAGALHWVLNSPRSAIHFTVNQVDNSASVMMVEFVEEEQLQDQVTEALAEDLAPSVPEPIIIKKPKPLVVKKIASLQTNSQTIQGSPSIDTSTNSVMSSSTTQVNASPDYLRNPAPRYPDFARRAKQQGVVELLVDVSADGRASTVSLSQSSGFDVLDSAAIVAVQNWRFKPAEVQSQPVSSRIVVPIRFELSKR